MSPPRIPPLPHAGRDPRTEELLAGLRRADGTELHIFSTLAHHPRLLRRWSQFGGVLLTGALPARDRELLILRTAWHCGAHYEWGQHVGIARAAGVEDDEIGRIGNDPDAAGWSEGDAALLRAADELHSGARISDPTWAALRERYDDQQLIEVCMVVGQYHLVAFTLNSLGVEAEPGLPDMPR
ncbi:MAG: carboxymuconolactone decarboxylase family protein [Acidimicrobiales bacterium]|nr:carboxymuconolactone decarboxylase family protein [Acidimicrobiales bacterium]